jgi:hypothetical protein
MDDRATIGVVKTRVHVSIGRTAWESIGHGVSKRAQQPAKALFICM